MQHALPALTPRWRPLRRWHGRAWILGLGLLFAHAADAAEPAATSAAYARIAHPVSMQLQRATDMLARATAGLPALQSNLRYVSAMLQSCLGAPTDAAPAWARVQALATAQHDVERELVAMHARGELFTLNGNHAELQAIGQDMLALAHANGHMAYVAAAYNLLGTAARRGGDLQKAVLYHQQALTLRRELGDRAGEAESLTNLGTTLRDQGQFALALARQHEALQIRLRQTRGDQLDITYRNLALLYREIDDPQQARSHFELAVQAARAHPVPVALASVLGSYAVFLNDVGEYDNALLHASQALDIDLGLGNRTYIALDRLQLGRALNGLGRAEQAGPLLRQALQAGRRQGQTEIIVGAQLELARIDLQQGGLDAAGRRVDAVIAQLDNARLMPLLTEAWRLRERIASARGDTAAALDALRHYMHLRDALVGTRSVQRVEALKSYYQRQQYNERIRLLTENNASSLGRIEQHRRVRNLAIGLAGSLIMLLGLLWSRYRATRMLNRQLAHKHHEVESARKTLEEVNATLREQSRKLYRLATRDPLTGVYNRRHMLQRLERRIERSQDVSALLIDFDHFKQVNDRLGHLFGDQVLCAGTRCMHGLHVPGQIVGRFGGEEFLVALFNITPRDADRIAERLRQDITRALAAINPAADIPITVSIGVATLSQCRPRTLKSLLGAADRAMYQAKAEGRNRVVSHLPA